MLLFNGLKFAKNENEMIDSLFNAGGTCAGFYKKLKNGFQLFNLQKELFAFVFPARGLVVSAYMYEGRAHYMHGCNSLAEKYLNLPDSYMAKCQACEQAKEL